MTAEDEFRKFDRIRLVGQPEATGKILHFDAEVGDGPIRVQWDFGGGESNHSAEQLELVSRSPWPQPPYPPQARDDRGDPGDRFADYGEQRIEETREARQQGWEV